ncbi:MAG TPA: FAD-dependent oxidoreductase, partial [Burkholderiales bacterium]|nr:FAD-dependent oxidoreductase [Burkholderiales bacterium]
MVTDVLIVGGGAAGLTLALRLADKVKVTIVAKQALTEGSSLYAQGGIAAVLNEAEDSFDSHIADTLEAGAGLCHRDTVDFVVRRGPAAIRWLIDQGVVFSRESSEAGLGAYHLTREGGHSHRRVVHAADATGRAVESTLESKVRSHPNIRLCENHLAVDLITKAKLGRGGDNRCLGLYVLDKTSGQVQVFAGRFIVLATGGASKAYLYSSNPDTSTGDGIAMAWRAGCRVADMEFMQ